MIRWAGPVLHIREVLAGLWWRNIKKISPLGRPSGSKINRIRLWTRVVWLRIGINEHGNEPLGSIKCGEFLE